MTIQPRSYDCIARDWIDRAVHGKPAKYNDRGHYGERVYVSGSAIFSYGRHFEMARVLYEGKGRNRRPKMILINGERASNTTTKHQGYVRGEASRSGLPSCIIPYGALEAANIDLDSINVLDAQPDKWLTIDHASTSAPRWAKYIDRAEYVEVEWSDEENERWNDWHDWAKHAERIDGLHRKVEWGIETWNKLVAGEEVTSKYWLTDLPKNYAELQRIKGREPADLGKPRGYGYMGDGAVYRPAPPKKLIPTGERVQGYVHHHQMGEVSGVLADGTPVRVVMPGRELHGPDDDGQWRWTTRRHILGESLIEADVRAHRMVVCSDCSGDGWTPSSPAMLRSKHLADVYGGDVDWRYVSRDDDHPMPATERRVPVPYVGDVRHGWNLWTNFVEPVWGIFPLAKEHYPCRSCSGRGRVQQHILRRKVKFLSGFDHGEPHLAYFFCELPKCDASTVDEAYEALKPEVVKLAEAMGRDVKRQGDIFAVETTATKKELMANAKAYGRRNPNVPGRVTLQDIIDADEYQPPSRWDRETRDEWNERTFKVPGYREQREASMLLGTNHQGTEVIQTKDGTIYARGCLWHVPDGRTNDHVRVKLGNAWHIIVKNTVPVRRS